MTKKISSRVVESAYFHISNSGLTINVVEDVEDWANHVEPAKPVVTWKGDVELSSFGIKTTFSFPLFSPAMALWIGEAFTRVGTAMQRTRDSKLYHWVGEGSSHTPRNKIDVLIVGGQALERKPPP